MKQIQFWSHSDKGNPIPEIAKIYGFLSDNGFYKKVVDSEIKLFRLDGNFIENATMIDMATCIMDYLHSEEIIEETNVDDAPEVWERFLKYGIGKIFNPNNWINLETLNVKILKHTRDKAYFFFNNCFISINKNKVQVNDYNRLETKFYVHKEHVINKDFELIDNLQADENKLLYKGGWSLKDFFKKISHVKKMSDVLTDGILVFDEKKHDYLKKLIGFCLHQYKAKGDTDFAPVFCDDEIGGSGKGILIQAMEQLTLVTRIPGKLDSNFDPITMTEKTRIKVYDDINKNFPLQRAYNEITDFGRIMHKHAHEIILSYEDSYKVVFTSNFILKGNTGADRRRQKVFDLYPWFNENNQPKQEYGLSFFSHEWKPEDWNYFYSLMFEYVKDWLACNYSVGYDNADYVQRKIAESYPDEFRVYIDSLIGGWHKTADLYQKFKSSGIDSPFVKKINSTSFGRMITNYLTEINIPHHKNSNRTELFIDKETVPTTEAPVIEQPVNKKGKIIPQQDLPF